jgi:Ca2+-binding RTX toxin-like protein
MEIENITGDLAGIAYHITGHAVSNRLTGRELNDTLIGLGGADTLNGLDGDDRLDGGAGNDRLVGGSGNDSLIGGAGQDRFVFDSELGSGNVDTVHGYNVTDDTILLDRSIFTGLSPSSTLAASAFVSGAGPAAVASDADHRIIYNTATGALLYDADGSGTGTAIQFATLTPIVGTVTNAEFLII